MHNEQISVTTRTILFFAEAEIGDEFLPDHTVVIFKMSNIVQMYITVGNKISLL